MLSYRGWFPARLLPRWLFLRWSFPRCLFRLLPACAAAVLAGCATQPVTQVTQVTLSGVVSGEKAIGGPVSPELVRLTRGGAEQTVIPEMVLQPGDAIRTGPDAAVVVSYPGGARAYVYPNTSASIGSLFLEIGRVFVKVKGAFQVRTTFVTAASEGTEYWVDVKGGEGVTTVVVEGQVGLYSNAGTWSTVLPPNARSVARGGVRALPQVSGPADPADIRREKDWVRRMDTLVPVMTGVDAAPKSVPDREISY